MRINSSGVAWLSFGSLLLLLLLVLGTGAGAGSLPAPSAAAQVSCPTGQEPLPYVSLAQVPLPDDVLPYSRMSLSRITVQPGETYAYTSDGYAAYYVEAGILKYKNQQGLAILTAPKCTSPDGRHSLKVGIRADRNDLVSVKPGYALISDLIPTGPIVSGGDEPLVMLVMALVPPMIDPETGEPIPDPVVDARAKFRAREQRRQACREISAAVANAGRGTPVAQAGRDAVTIPEECRKEESVQ